MKIILSPRAEKELKKLSKVDQIIIAKKIRSFKENLSFQEEKLSGFSNIYRVRVGNFRIVYKKTSQEIYIILIGHRRDIDDLLKRLF